MDYDVWENCYRGRWTGILTPLSFAHPAKVAPGLAKRIYEHLFEDGLLSPGERVLDPFGGVGGFAYHAMLAGLCWEGVELEPRFVDLGQGCDCTGISPVEWRRYYGRWKRVSHRDGRHWCPECLHNAEKILDEPERPLSPTSIARRARIRALMKKLSREKKLNRSVTLRAPLPLPGLVRNGPAQRRLGLFDAPPDAGTAYRRNSGRLPGTLPHHYKGNIETWEDAGLPGSARLRQGDSRFLVEHFKRGEACVSSPPYSGNDKGDRTKADRDLNQQGAGCFRGSFGRAPGNVGDLQTGDFEASISSPPFLAQSGGTNVTSKSGALSDSGLLARHAAGNAAAQAYGDDPGNLGNMNAGDLDGALTSPPYAESNQDYVTGWKYIDTDLLPHNRYSKNREADYGDALENLGNLPEGNLDAAITSPAYGEISQSGGTRGLKAHGAGLTGGEAHFAEYGETEGQLGRLIIDDRDLVGYVATSPPFEDSLPTKDLEFETARQSERGRDPNSPGSQVFSDYGQTAGQLGNESGETFWSASRKIVEQLYQVLKPGRVASFVVKAYIKDGKIVDFPEQWRILCEAVGFRTLHVHLAMLVENRGTYYTLDGEVYEDTVKRASFFRRLYESKYPENRIDWEVVLCMQKPGPGNSMDLVK